MGSSEHENDKPKSKFGNQIDNPSRQRDTIKTEDVQKTKGLNKYNVSIANPLATQTDVKENAPIEPKPKVEDQVDTTKDQQSNKPSNTTNDSLKEGINKILEDSNQVKTPPNVSGSQEGQDAQGQAKVSDESVQEQKSNKKTKPADPEKEKKKGILGSVYLSQSYWDLLDNAKYTRKYRLAEIEINIQKILEEALDLYKTHNTIEEIPANLKGKKL